MQRKTNIFRHTHIQKKAFKVPGWGFKNEVCDIHSTRCTHIVWLCLSLSDFIRVKGEAGGYTAEPDIPQHVFVICHSAGAPSGT